ncbi:MAG: redoxin domain-containing protein [Oscillatoriophycideae cyanobacterium NC_groundwater_1537_Pr4_S-0.65um_50_18]|nr:redoxin domain-containing protein [Oscillatoriophycideae cyanobacterium NC_groundwater_1537_Pr4_S-0.65um_50_18]
MARIRAPELPQDLPWLNCDRPLSLKDLKGRMVLLDFWTYCCINCLHVLPDLKYLEEKYKDSLTVIGVHTAKFDNEKEAENIQQAIWRYGIQHPVLVDNDSQVWQSYVVRAWPTIVLIDLEGYIVGRVSGEGKREALDDLIGRGVQEYREKGAIFSQDLSLSLPQPLETPIAFPGKVLAEGDRLYIADSGHHRIVITTLEGEVQQVIGTGTAGLQDGRWDEAQFASPQGMAIDPETQCLYVADTENHAIRCVYLQAGRVETIAGTGQQSRMIYPHSGPGLETPLNSPWDLAKVGNFLMIAMAGSHQIWALDLNDGLLGTYAGTGAEACVDGSLDEAAFAQPSGVAANDCDLFVADSEGSSIRAVGLETDPVVRTICGSGNLFGFGDSDGEGEAVRLQHCLGVAYGGNHQLWIADTYNHKIKRVDLRSGVCETLLGDGQPGFQDGQGQQAQFYEPSGLSQLGSILFIADTNNHTIRRVDMATLTVTTLPLPGLCAPDLCFPNLLQK